RRPRVRRGPDPTRHRVAQGDGRIRGGPPNPGAAWARADGAGGPDRVRAVGGPEALGRGRVHGPPSEAGGSARVAGDAGPGSDTELAGASATGCLTVCSLRHASEQKDNSQARQKKTLVKRRPHSWQWVTLNTARPPFPRFDTNCNQ